VKENQDKAQDQMTKLWGDNVSQQNISYASRKLSITQKNLRLSRNK
jgi:hypothetical protein